MPILGTEVALDERCEAPARTLRAAGFAAVAVVLLLALRARSDGAEPPLLVVVLSFGLLTTLARTLTTRERSWAVVFGAVFFGELPDAVAFAGMALIVLSGLFTFLREEQLYGWSRRTWLMRNGP